MRNDTVTTTTQKALTIGEISRRLKISPFRINYIIRTRGVQPTMRAGIARVFNESDLQFIKSELRRIDADKEYLS